MRLLVRSVAIRRALSRLQLRPGALAPRPHAPGGRSCTQSAARFVGLGYESAAIEGVGRTHLVRELMAAVDQPARVMGGVEAVTVRAALGAAGDEGALWRSLTVRGESLIEHIYCNPALGEVRRVPLQPDGSEGPLEIVHAVARKPPLRIEVYQRERHSLARTDWSVPLEDVAASVEATIQLARAKAQQDGDACYFGTKA
jgi:hypothetical protein